MNCILNTMSRKNDLDITIVRDQISNDVSKSDSPMTSHPCDIDYLSSRLSLVLILALWTLESDKGDTGDWSSAEAALLGQTQMRKAIQFFTW